MNSTTPARLKASIPHWIGGGTGTSGRMITAAQMAIRVPSSDIGQVPPVEASLEADHLSLVGLVIVTQAVQQAVQREDAQLARQRLSPLLRLTPGLRHADRHVSEMRPLGGGLTGEGEDIGRPVLSAEVAIPAPHGPVADEAEREAPRVGRQVGDDAANPFGQVRIRGRRKATQTGDLDPTGSSAG